MGGVSETERRLLNGFQRDFPLVPRPFRAVGEALGMGEEEVLGLLDALKARQVISRLGAVIRPNSVGASTLAAMSVPEARLEEVADIVNARPQVNHNYEREHELNLWFVVTGPSREAVLSVLEGIETETGISVIDLPLEAQYHIDLGFRL